jgi:hypothetical protein
MTDDLDLSPATILDGASSLQLVAKLIVDKKALEVVAALEKAAAKHEAERESIAG